VKISVVKISVMKTSENINLFITDDLMK
jgi:hypothetical protein